MTTRTGFPTGPATSPVNDLADARVPGRGRYDEASRRERLAWLRERTGAALDALDAMRVDPERLTGNLENAIGAVEVPVGLAGPLLFRGAAVQGVVYAPLATTEGTLVASASRGATALTRAGGVSTRVTAQRMTRAPAFEFATPAEAFAFASWAASRTDALRERVGEVSRHARLHALEPEVVGAVAHLIFVYGTGDAAGQNMTTATTWHACQWILAQLPAAGLTPVRFLVEGNASGDKKVSLRLHGGGRGFAAVAECTLDAEALRTLHVSAGELLAAYNIFRGGSDAVGMVSFNVNVANMVAALFTATGQDIACVHESSLGELTLEADPSGAGVRARVTLAGLVVGTVGGGTHLPAQRACLAALGCVGGGTAPRLAEIVAGYCLALELSTLSAIASGEFVAAHQRLGRNRPVKQLEEGELTAGFFEPGLRRVLGRPALRASGVERLGVGGGASILGELAAQRFKRTIGVLHRRVHHDAGHTDVVVKVKPMDTELSLMMQGLAASCGARVGDAYARFCGDTGFAGTHERELAVYAQRDPRFTRHTPILYDIVRDPTREIHALVLERLHGRVRLLDSADDPWGWGAREIEAAVRGAGALHAIWMGREAELLRQPWIGVPPTAKRMSAMRPLWEALALHAAREFPALMDAAALRSHLALVETIPDWWARLEAMPRTLAHNDFNPRNVAIRDELGSPVLCAYDWELATLHLPQHDVAELLSFVLPQECGRAEVLHLVELHREAVRASGAEVPDDATWRAGFALAAQDLLVNRFGLYLMAHTARHYGFLGRALGTLRRLVGMRLEAA